MPTSRTAPKRPRSLDHRRRVEAIRVHCAGDKALEFFLVRIVLEGQRNSADHADPERRESVSGPHNSEWYDFIGRSKTNCEPHERYQASMMHAMAKIGIDPANMIEEQANAYVTAFKRPAIVAGRDYIRDAVRAQLSGKPKRFSDLTRERRLDAFNRSTANKLLAEEIKLLNGQAPCPPIWLSDLELCQQVAHERGWISTIEELEYLYSNPHVLVRSPSNELSYRPIPEINLPKMIREKAWGRRYHYVDFSKSKVQFGLEQALALKHIDSDEHTLLWHCVEFFPELVENVRVVLAGLTGDVNNEYRDKHTADISEAIKTMWNASFDGGAVAGWNTVRERQHASLYKALQISKFVTDMVLLLNRVRSKFGKQAWSEYERWERGHRLALIKAARSRGVYCNTINDGLYFVSEDAAALSLLKSDVESLAAERRLLLKGRWQ